MRAQEADHLLGRGHRPSRAPRRPAPDLDIGALRQEGGRDTGSHGPGAHDQDAERRLPTHVLWTRFGTVLNRHTAKHRRTRRYWCSLMIDPQPGLAKLELSSIVTIVPK